MKQNAGEVMPGWIQPKELAIQHVRNPGHRVPVTGMAGGKGPSERRPGQACLDVRIFCDIGLVIVIQECMIKSRRKDSKSDHGQRRTGNVGSQQVWTRVGHSPLILRNRRGNSNGKLVGRGESAQLDSTTIAVGMPQLCGSARRAKKAPRLATFPRLCRINAAFPDPRVGGISTMNYADIRGWGKSSNSADRRRTKCR